MIPHEFDVRLEEIVPLIETEPSELPRTVELVASVRRLCASDMPWLARLRVRSRGAPPRARHGLDALRRGLHADAALHRFATNRDRAGARVEADDRRQRRPWARARCRVCAGKIIATSTRRHSRAAADDRDLPSEDLLQELASRPHTADSRVGDFGGSSMKPRPVGRSFGDTGFSGRREDQPFRGWRGGTGEPLVVGDERSAMPVAVASTRASLM